VIQQGEIWWAELPEARGSGRPVVVVQGDAFNRSRLNTILCVTITSNLQLADAPGNVLLPVSVSHLPKESVANVSQVITLDRTFLTERVGRMPSGLLRAILDGILLAMGM